MKRGNLATDIISHQQNTIRKLLAVIVALSMLLLASNWYWYNANKAYMEPECGDAAIIHRTEIVEPHEAQDVAGGSSPTWKKENDV